MKVEMQVDLLVRGVRMVGRKRLQTRGNEVNHPSSTSV